ncbi:GntR family transcriptional regulator [Thiomonas sp. FB-Cd]|uniref:GntR family transcriptional regulator n=1 Tax=Thiomonas sp. FB-Cd TaxID=1158292 RepID=UPI00068A971B|nr:GntR family transcriptional regulator [Thiomonas sp. FB-Cd]
MSESTAGRAMRGGGHPPLAKPASRATEVYAHLREDVFEFRLLPGQRFTETELAELYGVSRTPVREALLRLQSEGLVRGYFRSGWEVVPIDFSRFDQLYELRKLIEVFAVRRLASAEFGPELRQRLDALVAIWLVDKSERLSDARQISVLDEAFHGELVAAAGNTEMLRVHADVTDRIRVIRRLDFTYPQRIGTTYDEHAAMLRAIRRHRPDEAEMLVRAHIDRSQLETRKITLHRLQTVRSDNEQRGLT